MTEEEYEERRRGLEQELQSDLALIHAAHEARVRSLDRLRRLAMEEDGSAVVSGSDKEGHDRTRTTGETVPPAPAASRKPSSPPGAFLNDLEAILSELPEVFDKKDIVRLVGYEPTHSTFFRALTRLQDEGAVAVEDYSDGGTHTTYRKLTGSPPG
jgi:hypothetical protein